MPRYYLVIHFFDPIAKPTRQKIFTRYEVAMARSSRVRGVSGDRQPTDAIGHLPHDQDLPALLQVVPAEGRRTRSVPRHGVVVAFGVRVEAGPAEDKGGDTGGVLR